MDRSKIVLLGGMIAVASCLCATLPAQAMNLYTYDLDSLVYMSPQIVEGTLGRQHRTNNFTCWEIEISGVHKGALKLLWR
jgi:hypothetical protein